MSGVYLSHPFCRQKCTYCNFASGVFAERLEADYVRALAAEIEAADWDWTPETVYLGGGSPDRIAPADLRRLLGVVPGRPWKEATLEAAPGSITAELARAWADCGIDRVSLGVQSFVEGEIRQTARKHTAAIVADDVATLRGAGIGKINIDLIAGLPGQTAASWKESLGWIERLDAGHVSVYMLEVDDDSRLGRELLSGGSRYGAGKVPEAGVIAEFYEIAVERLAAIGLRRYEISNFARAGEESLHNLKYWTFATYAGFGADAHSFDGRVRRENVKTAAAYVERWRKGQPVVQHEEAARLDEERFFVGLRLADGIELRPEEWSLRAAPIKRFIEGGLLVREGDRLRLTGAGILLSNEVFEEFIEA